MNILIVQPAVGRAHEVLILDVDESLGLPDGRRVGSGDRVVHGATFLRREGGLVFQLKPEETFCQEINGHGKGTNGSRF